MKRGVLPLKAERLKAFAASLYTRGRLTVRVSCPQVLCAGQGEVPPAAYHLAAVPSALFLLSCVGLKTRQILHSYFSLS